MTGTRGRAEALLLRLVEPLARRGRHPRALAVLGVLASLAVLAAGYMLVLLGLWLPDVLWPLTAALVLLGSVVTLAGWAGLAAVIALSPILLVAGETVCRRTRRSR